MEKSEENFSSKDKVNISSEEAKQTINEVKNTIKNVDLKSDARVAKGFFKDFFKNPIDQLKKVATDTKNNFLKTAIIILIIWLVSIFFKNVFSVANTYLFGYIGSFSYFFKHLFSNILTILKGLVAPFISVLVLSTTVYCLQKNKNKSFLSIISTILVSKIPVVVSVIASLLSIMDLQILKLTSVFSTYCDILSTILLFFGIKFLSGEEENSKYFEKFALIIGIFYIIKLVFSYLGIIL